MMGNTRPRRIAPGVRVAAAFVGLLVAGSLDAAPREKANMTPDQLELAATHVIVGEVMAVYERKESNANWRYKRYVAEVRIDAVEKGEGLSAHQLAYVRYWTRSPRGIPTPSSSGHRGIPSRGETLRMYLARNAYDGFTKDNRDGGLNVIGANGFERLSR